MFFYSYSVEILYGLWSCLLSVWLILWLVSTALGVPRWSLCKEYNWAWDSLALELECTQVGLAVATEIARLAKQAFCLPPTPKPRA